jgi:pSer/pThr/pTyr-binding forkhead associated (FHA) protein
MAILMGMSGNLKGQRFELDRDEIFVGRNTTNDICIEDGSVSGQHCCINRNGKRFSATDLGSTNGTRLNGTVITQSGLRPKDIVQVGNVELMFDGQDVEVEEPLETVDTRVEVLSEPVAVPLTFHTTSPFGKRRDNRSLWFVVTALLVVLVLAALVFFLLRMYG